MAKRRRQDEQETEATANRRARRRRGTATLVLLVSLLGVWAVGPRVAEPIIRAKLQAMLEKHFDARLTMDDLSYEFPYGVRVHNAALVARDPVGRDVELVRIREVWLALQEIPWGDKPLLIERVVIDRPRVNLMLDHDGLVGWKKKPAGGDDGQDSIGVGGTQKLSDYFRLQRFEMNRGELAFDDRRTPDKGPVVWSDIHVGVDLVRENVAVYRYTMSARNEPLVHANVRGRLDVDARTMDVDRYVVAVEAKKNAAYSGLPPALRDALVSNEVEGLLTISGVAHIPLKDPLAVTHQTVIDLPDGRAKLASQGGSLDRVSLRVRVGNQLGPDDRVLPERRRPDMEDAIVAASIVRPSDAANVGSSISSGPAAPVEAQPLSVPPLALTIENFRVESGGSSVQVWRGNGQADPQTGYWRLSEIDAQVQVGADPAPLPDPIERLVRKLNVSGAVRFTAAARGPLVRPHASQRLADLVDFEAVAYLRGLTIQPPKFAVPITNVNGLIRATPYAVHLENVEANFCDDQFYIASARIPLDGANPNRELRFKDITGHMELKGNNENYPKPFEWLAKNIHPMGSWTLTGEFAWLQDELGACADYRFDIHSNCAGAAIGHRRIPVTDATCQIYASPRVIEIKDLRGKAMGGRVVVEGVVEPGKPCGYGLTAWVRDVDVPSLARYLSKDADAPGRVSGRLHADVRFWGKGKTPTASAADFVKAAGRFEIRDAAFLDHGADRRLAHDEARGEFTVRDRWIHFERIAVDSPVLGLQGDGWVNFDKRMKFDAIAAPMSDWKQGIRRMRIPIVGGVVGEVLGGVQGLLNVASRTMLYELRVSGTLGQPKFAAVFTPMLSDGVGAILGGNKNAKRAKAGAKR